MINVQNISNGNLSRIERCTHTYVCTSVLKSRTTCNHANLEKNEFIVYSTLSPNRFILSIYVSIIYTFSYYITIIITTTTTTITTILCAIIVSLESHMLIFYV